MLRKPDVAYEDTAAIYARFSSHNQREESIDAQVRACTEYAMHRGLRIVKAYTDSAKSGTNSEREQFQEMIRDSAKKKFRYLIIHKLDRFSRDKFDSVTYKRKLKLNGVSILSVTENLDDSPESAMLESCLEGMAHYFSMNLSREVMKGMKESAYKCTHLGGTPPLGYNVEPGSRRYLLNREEAGVVKLIFEKYAAGVGYNQILEHLNSMGYRTKRGRPFGKNSLHSILKNEKYVGTYIFNKRLEKNLSGKRNPTLKSESEWIVVPDGLPAIVDKETFDIVQAKMARNKEISGAFRAKELYLLSGLVKCGECGASMYGNTRMCGRNKSNYSSYRCSGRANHQGCRNKEVRRDYIDNFVLDELYRRLFSDVSLQTLASMLNEYNRKASLDSSEELNQAKARLEETQDRIRSIVRLVMDSGISTETVGEELRQEEERKRFLEKYLQELARKNKVAEISEAKVNKLLERSKEFVRTHNVAECRNFIDAYVKQVVVYDDKVEVFFKINVPDEASGAVVPLKSEESTQELHNEYKSVAKGWKRAELGTKSAEDEKQKMI